MLDFIISSRPLLSRSGCIYAKVSDNAQVSGFSSPFIEERLYFIMKLYIATYDDYEFSSPFIEERLYLHLSSNTKQKEKTVLVPFYRGAVVFVQPQVKSFGVTSSSRPLLSRSGCISEKM